ncbi:hypothetical protein N656DRAFT_131341 [Canariomyces notabilis]|uniref:Uncharacterized protein n=1 Tax=Canariomyces notabilis TaxID=2074819 RepID=A0AAN6TD74_9PEZI|nr:hypothetical protein N656DRAFT_131341 [Canariomyces arenarius]
MRIRDGDPKNCWRRTFALIYGLLFMTSLMEVRELGLLALRWRRRLVYLATWNLESLGIRNSTLLSVQYMPYLRTVPKDPIPCARLCWKRRGYLSPSAKPLTIRRD